MNVRKYASILLILIIIVLSVISYNQYKGKAELQNYLSQKLNEDIHSLVQTFDENNTVYDRMILTKKATKDQTKTLMINNENIRNIMNEYAGMAVKLNERKEGYQNSKTSFNADRLAHLFYDWYGEIIGMKQEVDMDEKMQQQIKMSKELNTTWMEAAKVMNSTELKLSHSDWLLLLDGLETNTTAFLNINKLESIEEIWIKRPGNK